MLAALHRPKSLSLGFTMIELMAVILLLGIMTAVMIPSTKTIFSLRVKSEGRKMAGYLQLAYQQAVLKNQKVRVKIDFDNNRYWLEEYAEQVAVPLLNETSNLDDALLAFRKLAENPTLTDEEQKAALDQQFQESTEAGLKPKTLSNSVEFSRIQILGEMHTKEQGGIVNIYIEPNGFVQSSVIEIKNQKGKIYSITMPAVGGRAQLEMGSALVTDG